MDHKKIVLGNISILHTLASTQRTILCARKNLNCLHFKIIIIVMEL